MGLGVLAHRFLFFLSFLMVVDRVSCRSRRIGRIGRIGRIKDLGPRQLDEEDLEKTRFRSICSSQGVQANDMSSWFIHA